MMAFSPAVIYIRMKHCHICENYPHSSDTSTCSHCQTIFCSICMNRYFPNQNSSSTSLNPKEGKSSCAVCDNKCKCKKCNFTLIAIDLFPLPFPQIKPFVSEGASKKQEVQGFMERMALRRKMLYEKKEATEPQKQECREDIQSQIEPKCQQQIESQMEEEDEDRTPKGVDLKNMIMEFQ